MVDEAIAPEVGDQVCPGHEEHLVRQRHLSSAQRQGCQPDQAATRTQFHDALVLPVVGRASAEQAGEDLAALPDVPASPGSAEAELSVTAGPAARVLLGGVVGWWHAHHPPSQASRSAWAASAASRRVVSSSPPASSCSVAWSAVWMRSMDGGASPVGSRRVSVKVPSSSMPSAPGRSPGRAAPRSRSHAAKLRRDAVVGGACTGWGGGTEGGLGEG